MLPAVLSLALAGSLTACSEETPLDEAGLAVEDLGEVDEAEAAGGTTTSPRRARTTARPGKPRQKTARLVPVAAVVDGDTIELASGRRVRLLQIDAPEVGDGECYAAEATAALSSLLPSRSRVRLERDPVLDQEDRYGRLLRYVFAEQANVNVALVRRGAASVWFYQGERGRYAGTLLSAARRARSDRRGLWRACPGARLDPSAAVQTSSSRSATPPAGGGGGGCDPSYRGACIPAPPPDLDCAQIDGPVAVAGSDPHRLDGNDDGLGCD
jgi:micrococcal nuclease